MVYYYILSLRLKNIFIYTIPLFLIFLVLIVTSSHTVTVSFFLPTQWSRFTVTVVDFYFLVFFLVFLFPMSVTTRSDYCLHPSCFDGRSYCRHIPPLGILLLDLLFAVLTTPPVAIDPSAAPRVYPIFLPMAAHPSKIGQDR